MSNTIIHLNEKRLILTGLHSDRSGQAIRLHFGVYQRSTGGRENWTGESLDGLIPLDALSAWALEQGYLRFKPEARP